MFVHIKTIEIKRAAKDHYCNACLLLTGDGTTPLTEYNGTFSFSEWRAIAKAKADGWKIKKGQPYSRAIQVYDGEIYSTPYRPEIHEIMVRHDLYPDE